MPYSIGNGGAQHTKGYEFFAQLFSKFFGTSRLRNSDYCDYSTFPQWFQRQNASISRVNAADGELFSNIYKPFLNLYKFVNPNNTQIKGTNPKYNPLVTFDFHSNPTRRLFSEAPLSLENKIKMSVNEI
ncbi:hypothetical protein DID80_02605 [Candidatus Marinamargulisbacteria bacterium SCGC AAA071-K20]|nr:hypothetical protein DID80_02605 [Candidatus Marinamargulisbacteria bacterium SCGC AAA071-K20]